MKPRQKAKAKAAPVPPPVAAPAVEETPQSPHSGAGFPIVGIGASAGGLAAFEAFFSGMPADIDPGMAFVLVQHLAPDHKSILAELIRRYTRMKVFQVEDGMVVQPNCAYIIPPGCDMAFLNGTLQLLAPISPRGQRLPIDFFFRSLAQDQHERAIGIVLSGTGSDGTLGVRAIKGEGGMVMAQNVASTEFDGMPRSAIATGLVDYEMPPAEMPAQLIAYSAHAFGRATKPGIVIPPKLESATKKIFVLLRSQTGHDFSQYKPSTVHRRIERRMAVHQIESMESYVQLLQQRPEEVDALFGDLLIGVTNFFRDPAVFTALEEQVVPRLFAGKSSDGIIRVWSAGCSTGEEAYSLAILLQERMEAIKQGFTVQVFATDIDRRAIATARQGLYPASIAADITSERLARFFTLEADGSAYRVHKGIRDMLVFSEQDLIKDPPFSKLDLILCRNLLIYLGTELQKRLLPLFHYALRPGGCLCLGTSETVGEFGDLFDGLDRKAKLFLRREDSQSTQRLALGRFLSPVTATQAARPPSAAKTRYPVKLPLRDLTEDLLLQLLAPVGALVNSQGDILYLHGRAGLYLEPAAGEAGISNVLKMARDGLRPALGVGLRQAATKNEVVRVLGLNVKTNGHYTRVNLIIHPVATVTGVTSEMPLYLVVLEEAPASEAPAGAPAGGPATVPGSDARIKALKQELRAQQEYLQSAHEELESSTEELKSSNEEMQSVNEELQSTNEELETSKEELQSVNEELATVNTELQTKVLDLSRANNDMNNLLAGSGIATIFLDHQLRILRFTPTVKAIINLLPTDVGRPVAHFVSNLVGYNRLVTDAQAVLDTLTAKVVDVQTQAGVWFMMRIQPYRTLEHVIEGVVLTFVDVTETRLAQEALRVSELRYLSVLSAMSEGIVAQDLAGVITAWNPAAERILGLAGEQLRGRVSRDSRWRSIHADGTPFPGETHPSMVVLQTGVAQLDVVMGVHKPDDTLTWISINAEPVLDPKDRLMTGVVTSFTDITERRQMEQILSKANEQLRLAVVVRDAHDAITVQDLTGRTMAWNPGAVRMYGWSEAEALAMNVQDRIPEGLRIGALATLTQLSQAKILQPYATQRLTKSGAKVEVSIVSTALLDEAGRLYAIATTERVVRGQEP